MRVLTLSWEYPPLVYGGLGRHVGALTRALAAEGHAVTAATQGAGGDEVDEGVQVLRADPADPVAPRADLLAWVATLGHALTRTALRAKGGFDVLHAHDWVVGQAAATVQDVLGLPLVVTFHATEAGRHQGWLPGPLSRSVHATEAWLAGRAHRTIACSRAAAADVRALFGLAADRVAVVPNGIDPAAWDGPRPAGSGHGPLVVLTARLEYEKGVHTLLRAVPELRRRHPDLRVVVAGTGTYEAELHALAATLRPRGAVRFAGRIDDGELAALMRSADVAV
ncbi:MAG TPA: glycosyltransferase family 4 protein, partial [Frankiaceae bacterium]|nr:glycosyltransferase family 4 protein [Frankiaceae bacterium]